MFFAMTLDQYEKFLNTCVYKEAITYDERMAVLAEMIRNGEILQAGNFTPEIEQTLQAYFEKTNHKGIIGIKANESDNGK